jgi:hypothetical protein
MLNRSGRATARANIRLFIHHPRNSSEDHYCLGGPSPRHVSWCFAEVSALRHDWSLQGTLLAHPCTCCCCWRWSAELHACPP